MLPYNITVGIRAYNVEQYIEQCLDSLYNLTIKDNIKIVLINDCSTDGTQLVINNWIDNHLDFNICVTNNTINKGAGIMLLLLQQLISNTEYVILLDGENFYLNNDCLEYMYNFIKKHEYDFVRFSSELNSHHTTNLMRYELYLLIKFNPFRYNEDHYDLWLVYKTNNYVLHNYNFLYYRNINKPLSEKTTILKIFDDVYYKGFTESVELLQFITPDLEYEELYNTMLLIKYEIHPAVLVLSKAIDLTEWIAHYKSLGFEYIFVVGNNLLSELVINIPYNYTKFNSYTEFRSLAYDYALQTIIKTNTNYLLVIDDDEYLLLKDHNNITSFIIEELAGQGRYNCDFVQEAYDDNDIIYELALNTYNRKAKKQNHINWTKSLFRLTPNICYNKSDNPVCYPGIKDYSINKVHTNKAVLKHYITKCLETFIKSKVACNNFDPEEFGETKILTAFFKINKCTENKLLAYRKLCNAYNIDIDEEEYLKHLNLVKNNKIALIVPINNLLDLIDAKKILKSEQYDIVFASIIDIEYSENYKVIRGYSSIYDCLNYTIKLLEYNYTAIVFPTSKLYENKIAKQLSYLLENDDVDIVTCDCICNGVKNTKPIISTIMFKTDSVKKLLFIFEHYYDSYDKFFVNCKNLNIANIDEVLQEEKFFPKESVYDIYNLESFQDFYKPLTAVINFRNEGYEIEKTIQSIRATTKGIPILLIDDCSNDDYDYKSIAHKYKCQYIRNPLQLGAACSRDLGARMCNTPYFILLDGHMRFYNLNWDELFINLLKENPKRLICGNSTTITKTDDTYYGELNMSSATFGAFVDFHKACEFNTCWAFNPMEQGNISKIACVLGACYASSKEHWEYIDGLNGLIKYGYEEPLMSIKTWMCGGECLLIKNIYIGHLYRNLFPCTVTKIEMLVNQIFLAMLFGIDTIHIYENIDSITRTKVLKLLDFDKIEQLKNNLNSIKIHPFEYFLSINNKAKLFSN